MAKDKNAADDILKDLEQFDSDFDLSDVQDILDGGMEVSGEAAAASGDTGGAPIVVKVAEDKSKAYAKVKPPSDTDEPVTKDDVFNHLVKHGVTHGVDEEAINEIFQFGTYNTDVVVAKSTPPSDGEPARIDYKFDVEGKGDDTPVLDEKGNVDHKAVKMNSSVEPGGLLAVKIPAVIGHDGTNVKGEPIPAREGKDIPLPVGDNTEATEDGLGVISKISGQPALRDGKINVNPVYEISEDVSYKTGNIDFQGSVHVKGNVNSDFSIKATENVEVDGNVDKALIEAGGDIKLKGGLYGANVGKLVAGGSVYVRSVDSGIVEAGKDITIGQQARMSTLMAGENIILKNSKGSIVGGKSTAGSAFDVTNLGSTSFTETIIEIGLNPKLKKVHEELEKHIEDCKAQMERVAMHIKNVKKKKQSGGTITEKDEAILKKMVPAFHKLRSILDRDMTKLKYLDDRLSKMNKGKAIVRGTTYPGVKMYTLNAQMGIQKEINYSAFSEQNEQIIVGPI